MTAQPITPTPVSSTAVNWTMIGVLLAVAVQFAVAVSNDAKAQAEIAELKATTEPLRTSRGALTTRLTALEETTKPLREGALVKIETDVAWIRQAMEAERSQ